MTDEAPIDLVTNLELRFAYSPTQGRLWRTDGAGTPIRELTLWRWDEDRGQVKIGTIRIGVKYKMMTHVIHYIMTSEWPAPGMYIDHKDRNPTNNAFANLREVTPTQNAMNTDRGGKYWHAKGEELEQGTTKTPHGTYQVVVMGVHIGTYRSRVAANEACRNARRELKGAFDVPFVTSRRIIRGTAP
jgi:hypothetical protein